MLFYEEREKKMLFYNRLSLRKSKASAEVPDYLLEEDVDDIATEGMALSVIVSELESLFEDMATLSEGRIWEFFKGLIRKIWGAFIKMLAFIGKLISKAAKAVGKAIMGVLKALRKMTRSVSESGGMIFLSESEQGAVTVSFDKEDLVWSEVLEGRAYSNLTRFVAGEGGGTAASIANFVGELEGLNLSELSGEQFQATWLKAHSGVTNLKFATGDTMGAKSEMKLLEEAEDVVLGKEFDGYIEISEERLELIRTDSSVTGSEVEALMSSISSLMENSRKRIEILMEKWTEDEETFFYEKFKAILRNIGELSSSLPKVVSKLAKEIVTSSKKIISEVTKTIKIDAAGSFRTRSRMIENERIQRECREEIRKAAAGFVPPRGRNSGANPRFRVEWGFRQRGNPEGGGGLM